MLAPLLDTNRIGLNPVHVSRNNSFSLNAVEALVHPNIITIKTSFDWNLEVNKKIYYSKANDTERVQVTERERSFALQAERPITIEGFEMAVRRINFFLEAVANIFESSKNNCITATKRPAGLTFVYPTTFLDGAIFFWPTCSLNLICFNRNTIRINDKGNKSLSIISAVPEEFQRNLFDKIDLIFPGALRNIDTTSESVKEFFIALHLVWYNRYARRACYSYSQEKICLKSDI